MPEQPAYPPVRRRPKSLLVRYGDWQFSTGWCHGYRKVRTLGNGEQGRTFWLGPLVLEARWGPS